MFATETAPVSPRIARLERAVEAGDPTALDAFWQEVASTGSPLMEPVDGDPSQTLVTFLWRDPGDTENVLVMFYSAPKQGDLGAFAMRRLGSTDLWYKTYLLPSDLRSTYLISVNDSMLPFDSYAEVVERLPQFRPDPLNPRDFSIFGNPHEFRVSVLELPKAPAQPWTIARRGVPKGKNHMQVMDSDVLGTQQHVTVHVPPGYRTDGPEYGLFLLFDGWSYLNFAATTTMMDNLLYTGRTEPYVLVLHSNLDQAARARELPCHPPFADYLAKELLPWVHEHFHVTSDPARTVVGGSCFGGLAAAYVALRMPDVFGNVISQSGSFWWPEKGTPDLADEWLIEQYLHSPRLPIRFSMEVGSLERAIVEYDQVETNRRLRDVLLAKGYEVDYSEYTGGHDMICWRGSLVNRFLAVAGKR
ncbi:MAG: enterochelin esterase [Micromonosporaceae bacterium]|nr:enterochelin esterase [Micromonosporaceae bacterium]